MKTKKLNIGKPASAREIQNSLSMCRCGTACTRSDVFDAYFCLKCLEWLEDVCGDDECPFCARRPKRPARNQK